MKTGLQGISTILTSILILLFRYTGLDKLIRFDSSRNAFHNQVFPAELAEELDYAIPITEGLIALLLPFSVPGPGLLPTAYSTGLSVPDLGGSLFSTKKGVNSSLIKKEQQ